MSKKKPAPFLLPCVTKTTCREAREISKAVGARVFWRPNGVVNWHLPELDEAQILEG